MKPVVALGKPQMKRTDTGKNIEVIPVFSDSHLVGYVGKSYGAWDAFDPEFKPLYSFRSRKGAIAILTKVKP